MVTLRRDELAFLAILSHPELTMKALRLYSAKTVLFNEVATPHLAMMWEAYLQLLQQYKKEFGCLKISKELIAAGLTEAVQQHTGSRFELHADFQARCNEIISKLLEDNAPSLEEGQALLQYLIQLDTNRALSVKVTQNAGIEELQRILDRNKKVTTDIITEKPDNDRVLFEPLREIDHLALYAPRTPTGINWLDVASAGGGRAGELWLILGPSSGGKTVITIQYACAQALMGNGTLWATYEQSLEGDLAERMISCVTGESLDDIRDRGFTNLSKEIQDKFWNAVAGVSEKLKVLDMTKLKKSLDPEDPQDNGGMYTVWKFIKKLKAEGCPIKTVVIDWIGAMMSMIGAVTGKNISNDYRFAVQAEIDIARTIVKEEKVQIIFFHQTDTKTQAAKPTYAPDKTASADFHGMCFFFDNTFTIGNRDKNNICYFNSAKARKGNAICQTLQLIGDRAKFVLVKGWLPNRDGNFYKPSEGGSGATSEEVTSYSREVD